MADAAAPRQRIESIDLLRGLVMAFMAMDHLREFLLRPVYGNVFRVATVAPSLFFNRWLTHLCAPTFCLLVGAGAALQLSRGIPRATVARFLIVRGLMLIVLEPTVISFGWFFNFDLPRFLQVIFALGVAMCILAAFLSVRPWTSALVGAAFFFSENLLDAFNQTSPLGKALATLFLGLGFLSFHGRPIAFVGYPIVPWTALVLLGFWFGTVFARTAAPRRWLVYASAGLLALFVVLRGINRYGDPVQWSHEATHLRTFMSFIAITKYPPSLLYCAATLGVSLLLLALFEHWHANGFLRRLLLTFGRVPFFFYIVHIYVVHSLAIVLARLQHADWRWWIRPPPGGSILTGSPPNYGISMAAYYCVWIAVLLALYPLCRWYGRIRPHHALLHYL